MSGSAGEVRLVQDGAVWRVELANPARRNALTWTMYEQLQRICLDAAEAPGLRAVVIRGADGAFAAGTDINQFTDFASAEDGLVYERHMAEVLDALLSVPVPVIGVVEGPAVGGGLAIAACCDVLVAAEDACFGIPIARTLGNLIAPAVMRRLRERLGPARTTAMLMTSRLLPAAAAAAAGFVHTVTTVEEVDEAAGKLLARILDGAPLTLAAVKELDRRLSSGESGDPAEDLVARCYGSADFREGMTAFLEHRQPIWQGR